MRILLAEVAGLDGSLDRAARLGAACRRSRAFGGAVLVALAASVTGCPGEKTATIEGPPLTIAPAKPSAHASLSPDAGPDATDATR